jgi:hypothetical protein
MCERTYIGCPNCGEPADRDMTWFQEQCVVEHADLDAEGNIGDFGEPDFSEPHDSVSGYKCEACGTTSNSLDEQSVSDECECRECDPETAITDPGNADEIVLLVRINHQTRPDLDFGDAPDEIVRLFSDRALSVVPVRAERAAYLYRELWLPGGDATVDLTTPVPTHLQEAA